MDDLDRLSLEVALSILRAEADAPGSQKLASVNIAQQILAHLQPAEQYIKATSTGRVFDSVNGRTGSD